MPNFFTIRNLPWVALDRFINLLVALIVIGQFARYLGPAEFAEFSLATTIVALLSAFVMLGLQEVVTKDIRNSDGNNGKIIFTALVMQITIACLFCILFYLTSTYIGLDSRYSDYLSLLVVTLLFKFGETISVFFDASLNTKPVARIKSIIFFTFSILKLVAIYNNLPILNIVALFVIEQGVFLLALLNLFHKEIKINRRDFDTLIANSYIKRGLPILFSGIVGVLYLKIDIFLAYEMVADIESVGNLAAVTRLIEASLMIPVILCSALGPRIYEDIQNNASVFLNKLDYLIKLVSTYTIICFLVFLFTADVIIRLLYGENFSDASNLLRLHGLVLVFIGFNLSGAKFYIGKGYLLSGLIRNLIALAIVFIIGINLGATFGVFGIAIGTLSGVIYAGILHDLFFRNANDLFRLKVKSFNLFLNFKEILDWKKRKWEF